jgi:N-acetylglucosamine kinase-like BadF-type ATPase
VAIGSSNTHQSSHAPASAAAITSAKTNLQNAVKRAIDEAGITKTASCHTFST